jgi:hypothetical protein
MIWMAHGKKTTRGKKPRTREGAAARDFSRMRSEAERGYMRVER